MPTERELSDDEREELQAAAQRAVEGLSGAPEGLSELVAALEARLLARRLGKSSEEEAFDLGALFAACLEMGLGWELVELTWDEGLVALAVVEMDRSLAVLPFLAVDQLFARSDLPSALASTFERLSTGERPPGLVRGHFAVLLPA